MNSVSRWSLFVLLLVVCFAGCSRNPEVRKRNYLDKGNSYLQQAKYQAAIIEYQNAIQIDPKFGDAHFGLAKIFLQQGDWNHAYQELSRTVEYDPANWKAQIDLGNLMLAGGNKLEARHYAETVLQSQPDNVEAEVLLANSDAALGLLPKAITEAQDAVRMDPKRSTSYSSLAELQERNKDISSAEENYQKAVSVDPKSAAAILMLGRFYVRQNRLADAQREFQSAITLSPHDPSPPALLAELYLSQGHKDLAEQVLQNARNNLKDNPTGYRLLGNFYLSQGEWNKAATELASLHSEHPNDAAVTKSYIEALIELNRLDDAQKINDALLKNSPSDEGGLIFRGEMLVRQGKANDAIPVLAAAVRIAPENVLAHYQLGVAYAAASNPGQAQSEWQEAARLSPNTVEPQRALAALALRQRDFSLLTTAGEKLIQLEPHSSEGYVFHAQALLAKGDGAGAQGDLKKAIEVAPRDPAPLIHMGDLLIASKQLDEASKFYNQALALDPSASQALAGLVAVDLERKQPAQALRRMQDQLTRVPASTSLYTLLGQVELRNQDEGKAEEAFQKAIDLDKHNTQALLFLGNTEAARGAVDQAIANYQRGIQNNPREVNLYVSLGSLFERQGNWQRAEDSYNQALQIQSDNAIAANNLAYLMLEHGGNVNVALTLAQTGRRGMPDVPSSADTLGWAYYYQGAYNSAIDTLQQAVDKDPKNPNIHYHLGMAYEKTHNYAMAKKQLEYTLQISPNYPHADEIRKVLSQTQ